MNEPLVTRATLRIEYSDGQVRECDVPAPHSVRLNVISPDLPDIGDPGYLYQLPMPVQARRVEMSMEASRSLRGDSAQVMISEKPYVLDPVLAEFLDWPLYFPDDSVHCDKFPACKNRDCCDPESGRVFIASARRLTIREFLADIKQHAEESSG